MIDKIARWRRVFIGSTLNWNSSEVGEKRDEERFLGVKAVLGLVEDDALLTVDDGGADLFAAVRGEAVHEERVFGGRRHQLGSDAVRKKRGDVPLGQMLFIELPHQIELLSLGLGIERGVVGVVDELGHGGKALVVGQHTGFGETAGGAFAHDRRGIIVHGIEQGHDG